MICIIFKLKRQLPTKKQDRVLEEIKHWYQGNRSGRVHRNADDADKLSLCYVYVADDKIARETLKRLHKTSEVEYAHIPAPRHALNN